MQRFPTFKVSQLRWDEPVLQIRLGGTDLAKAPWNIELMADPKWKAYIRESLTPPIETLNDKLLDHAFEFFPFGKSCGGTQVQYKRIFTNIQQFGEEPRLTHGRIYPLDFIIPGKAKGWRQKTLINDQPTTEIDVHASGLRLLSEDAHIGFDLPDTEDLYSHGPLSGLNRNLTKTIVQTVINGVSLDLQDWPKSLRESEKTATQIVGEDWLVYANALRETYPALLHVRPDHGTDLMLIESEIIIRAMNVLLDKGIGCLSIHDCLIVPTNNKEDAKDAFRQAYIDKGFSTPKLTVSWSTT